MRLLLVLGCWGRTNDGLIVCGGVANDVLDITAPSDRNVSIADYLDTNFHMLKKPLYGNAHNVIYNIQEKFGEVGAPVFPEAYYRRLEEFCT